MIGEVNLDGVFVPSFGIQMIVAFVLTWAVRRVLVAFGAYRLVWHRALFDLALYVILLGAVAGASSWIAPL